ncbi:MAG: tetratricopeptide repeat protein, partial [Planctomycetota bacterium]
IATAFGFLGNPNAGKNLWESLELIGQDVLRFKDEDRPTADMNYMIALAQAISNSTALSFSEKLKNLRWKMGGIDNLFMVRTDLSFKKLTLLDQLETIHASTPEAFLDRALLKYEIKDYEGAIVDSTEAIRLNPQFATAYINRGSANYNKGDYEGAILDFTETLRLDPQFLDAYHYRGIVKDKKGDRKGATEDFSIFLKRTQNTSDPQIAQKRQSILKQFPELGK